MDATISRQSLLLVYCNWFVRRNINHLILAYKPGYLPESVLQSLVHLIDELRRMLNGYIAFLKRRKRGENEPGVKSQIHKKIEPYIYENLLEPPNP